MVLEVIPFNSWYLFAKMRFGTGNQCGSAIVALIPPSTLVWLLIANSSASQRSPPVALCTAPSVNGSPRVDNQPGIRDLIRLLAALQAVLMLWQSLLVLNQVRQALA